MRNQGSATFEFLQEVSIGMPVDLRSVCAEGVFFLGEVFFGVGQKEKALEHLKRAKEMFVRMGMDSWQEKTERLLEKI